ncbi:armadillo-type protein [Umbelopsis sp. PMI_123]|nr:armadillo-type protein [Umbelopsis sp. PMI_123]
MVMDMDEGSTLENLQFALELVLGGRRSLPVATLLERLKTLQAELEECEQNSINLNSLENISKQLVSSELVRNRDKRVRAVTACCLADVLKLYAVGVPPYNDSELKTIFALFISQLKELADITNEYYRDRFYLLESLSMVQSILIIKQLSNSASVMTELFRAVFTLANSGIENKVQVCLVDVMIQLVDEVRDIPREVAESIFEQLKQKGTVSHRMAVELCKNTSEVLQRYVCQYFSDILLEAKVSDNDEDYEQLNEAHELIQEIHRTVPDLLLNVIPQLEEEIKVDELHVRTLGTKTLGTMFSERNSFIADSYPLVWKSWLNRRNDKMVAIRILVIENLGAILKSHSSLSQDIISCIEQKLMDPEEKVRAAVCKALKQLELDVIKHQVPKSTLEKLSLRCKDKKPLVQQEALEALAFLFDQAYDEILLGSEESLHLFMWIPTAIINCIYVDDSHLTCSIEKVLVDHIIPPNEDAIERSKRMLLVLQSLDARATKGFEALMQRQHVTASIMQRIIETCRATTTSDHMSNGNLELLIKSIATKLPEPIRVSNNLRRFCDLSDDDLLNSLEAQLDAQFEYSLCRNQANQVLERVEQVLPGTSDTFTSLIRRMSIFLFDKESISYLLQLESNSIMDEGYAIDMQSAARKLLTSISTNFPGILRDQLDNLAQLLLNTSETHLADDSFNLLALLCKQFPNVLFLDSNAASKLLTAAKSGSPEQVEYATMLLTNAYNADTICEDLFNEICSSLEPTHPDLYIRLIALNQIAAFTTSYFDSWDQRIADFLIEKIKEPDSVSVNDVPNPVWVETKDLPLNDKTKLVALAILVNRLKKAAKSTNTILSTVTNVFDLLWSLLDEPKSDSRLAIKAQLRLASALAIATLSQLDSYSQLASVKNFEKLALTVQDAVYEVRAGFSEMIIRDLQSGALHPRYFPVLFLLAYEPEKDLLRPVKAFLKKHAKVNHGSAVAQKSYIEMSLVQLVHLLAHHPDFGESEEEIKLFIPYIELFLDCVATSDNISFLYHIGQKFKATTDAVDPSYSKNSYILSDLICALMQQKCKASSWSLTSYPGRVKLYTELYTSFATNELQTENMRRTFMLPTVLQDKENLEMANNQSNEKKEGNNTKRVRATAEKHDSSKKTKTTPVPIRRQASIVFYSYMNRL